MARNDKTTNATPPEAVISIIGVGMTLTGNCETDGALRIEGTVKGDVRAGKSVVIGKEGLVDGNIFTQDAIISGRVLGAVHVQSRLELKPSGQISGEIQARRLQLEEGASVEGEVSVGEAPPVQRPEAAARPEATGGGQPPGPKAGQGNAPAQSGKANPPAQGKQGQTAAAPPEGGGRPGNQPLPRPRV